MSGTVNSKTEVIMGIGKEAEDALEREIQKLKDTDHRYDEKRSYWNALNEMYHNDPSKIGELMTKKFGD
jgi:hypothetical protein|tara:strand:+ start:261 stop:467 length:207 start_codon:yes stop_codon:yes gene_type:complete